MKSIEQRVKILEEAEENRKQDLLEGVEREFGGDVNAR